MPKRDYSAPYSFLINDISKEVGVPANLIRAVMNVESHGRPAAVSEKGARGLMQVMPETQKMLQNWYPELKDIKNGLNPRDNIRLGAHYLKKLMELHGNDTEKVIAGYFTGHNREFLKREDWKNDPKYKQWGIGDYVDKVKSYLSEMPPEQPSMEPSAAPEMNRREATETKRRNLQAILDNLKARPDGDPQTIRNLEKIIQRYANFDLPGQEAFPREQPMDYVPPTARDREFNLPDIQTGPQGDRPLPPRYYDEGQRVTAPDRRSTVDPSKLRERDLAVRNWQEPATWSYPLTSPEQQAGMPDYFRQQPQGLQGPSETYADKPYTKGLQGPSETYADKPYTQGLQGPSETYADIPYGRGNPMIKGQGSMAPQDARSVPLADYMKGSPGTGKLDSLLEWKDQNLNAYDPMYNPTKVQRELQPQESYSGRDAEAFTDKLGQSMAPQGQAQPAATAETTQAAPAKDPLSDLLGSAAASLGISLIPRGEGGEKSVDFSSVTGSDNPKEQSWLRKAWETGEKYLEPVAEYGKYLPIPYVQQGLTAIDAMYDVEDAVTAANRGDYLGAVMEGAGAVGSAKDFKALQQGGGPNPLSGYNVLGDQAESGDLHKGLQKTGTKIATDAISKAVSGGYCGSGSKGGGGSGSPYMGQADAAAERYRQQSLRAGQDYQRMTGGRLSAQGIQGPTREGIIGRQAANLTASTQQNISNLYSQAAQREHMAQIVRDRQDKQNWMVMLKGLSDMYGIATMDTEPTDTENPYLPSREWEDQYINPGGQDG